MCGSSCCCPRDASFRRRVSRARQASSSTDVYARPVGTITRLYRQALATRPHCWPPAGAAMLGVVVLVVGLVYFTAFGLRIRASIDNVEMASVLGISPQRIFTMVFALAAAMAVLAGALVAPTLAITPTMGLAFIAPAFFSVLIAREGSIIGPVIGAAAVQFVLIVLKWLLPVTLAECLMFALLVVMVATWPRGFAWK
ncbi:hypothetical protein AB4144_15945 [Rhizobiaceae sp. 2RAB30]